MTSIKENLDTALAVIADALKRKEGNHRDRAIRPSRINHQHAHTVGYRSRRLGGFRHDLDLLQKSGEAGLRDRLKQGLRKCYSERNNSADKMAEWLLYEDELESRGLTDLLP